MPLFDVTQPGGTEFDGSDAAHGLLDFPSLGVPTNDETTRAVIMSATVINEDSGVNFADVKLRLVPVGPVVLTTFIEIASNTDVPGVVVSGCNIVVPVGWGCVGLTTEAGATVKRMLVDWRRVTLPPVVV